MAVDERNFRSYYYEKVGFRGVEEKKSLEILLKERPFDASKLRQFCIRFPVPALYRNLLWKVLFGILPVHVENQEWVWQQRCMQYDDLSHALDVMGYTKSNSPLAERIVLMWLLEERRLNFDHKRQLAEPLQRNCLAITESIVKMFDSEAECYWFSKGFFVHVKKFEKEIKNLKQVFANKLETEDVALYKHLTKMDAWDVFPLNEWFGQCFAKVLPESALERIWDKLVGGSCKILMYVTLAMLLHLRRPIFSVCKSGTDVLKYIVDMTEETADLIATKAVDLWQQNGSPLALNEIAVHPSSSRTKP